MKSQNKIYYFFDVLCGWCYGFSPVIQQIHNKYHDFFSFEIFSGGMIVGDRIGPIGQVAGYIKDAYKQVEEVSGIQFGEPFLKGILEEGSSTFSSIPPSIALTLFKQMKKEDAFDFAATLQKAVYYDGIQVTDYNAYGPYAEKYGINPDEFVEKMQSEEAHKATQIEFHETNEAGIQGFPTLLATIDDEVFLLARGFTPFDKLDNVFEKLQHFALAKQENQ